MPTKTIAYLRVSTDKQADRGVSLDAQCAKVKAYAELYDLSGRRAGSRRKRAEFRAETAAWAGSASKRLC